MLIVTLISGHQPASLHHHKKNAQPDGQNRPDDVEHGGKGKVQAGEENVILKDFHDFLLSGLMLRV